MIAFATFSGYFLRHEKRCKHENLVHGQLWVGQSYLRQVRLLLNNTLFLKLKSSFAKLKTMGNAMQDLHIITYVEIVPGETILLTLRNYFYVKPMI